MASTSKLNEYREAQRALAELTAQLQKLEEDKQIQKEMEFETKLKQLMADYNVDLRTLVSILDPQIARKPAASAGRTRKARTRIERTYCNPNTGEKVTAAGFNHTILKAWRRQYGDDVVRSWIES